MHDFATLLYNPRFQTNDLFISRIFHVIFSERGEPRVTETVEDKTVVSSFLKSLIICAWGSETLFDVGYLFQMRGDGSRKRQSRHLTSNLF